MLRKVTFSGSKVGHSEETSKCLVHDAIFQAKETPTFELASRNCVVLCDRFLPTKCTMNSKRYHYQKIREMTMVKLKTLRFDEFFQKNISSLKIICSFKSLFVL